MAIPDGDTMYVEGRHIYTAAGEKVILRGVNEMFVWSDDKTGINTLPEIAKTGANCVRLVWTEEEGNKNILVRLIENCIENKMIAMPECHSATGEWENLDVCINFWKDPVLIEGVQKYKKWTLVNIGNEVGDGNVTASQFRAGYMRAIDSLRSWGYTVPIVIDASTWGQNVDVIFSTWKDLLTHDPLKNVIFSVHSYWSTPENYNRIATRSVNEGLPVIVGEGPSPTSYPRCQILDFEAGLSVLGRNDIGWLAWSWGLVSNGHCIPNFDHTTNGKFGYWETGYSGSMIVRHEYSLMKTARRPLSFFDNDTVPVAGIWINSEKKTAAGDSVLVDIVISPANVFDNGYSFEITGDTAAVSFNPASGWLTTHSPGNITLKATSNGDNSIFAIRTLEIQEVPVSAISIEPSNPEIFIGDTIYLDVSIFPENATNKEFTLLITDDNSAVEFDESSMILIALDTGIVEIQALWDYGDVEGQTMITIHDPTVGIAENDKMKIMVYPNPFTTCLNIDNSIMSPYRLMVFNLTGNKILDENRFGNTRIDTHRLLPGYYEIIITFDEYTIREKLIKI